MTSWVTASIEKVIIPALHEAIRQAEKTSRPSLKWSKRCRPWKLSVDPRLPRFLSHLFKILIEQIRKDSFLSSLLSEFLEARQTIDLQKMGRGAPELLAPRAELSRAGDQLPVPKRLNGGATVRPAALRIDLANGHRLFQGDEGSVQDAALESSL